MSVRPASAARSSELIALSDVKTLLGVEDSSEDVLLARLITAASASLIEECQFPLGRQTYEEKRLGPGIWRQYIYLSRLPVEPESLEIVIDGEAVTDWGLQDPERGHVFREDGWPCSTTGAPNLTFTYRGGYVLPNDIVSWSAGATIASGTFARSSSPSLLRFECTTAGTTGESAPSWPDEAGETVTDGSVVWTARTAWELPQRVQDLAYALVLFMHSRRGIAEGLASVEAEGTSVSWFATQTQTAIPPSVRDGIQAWAIGRGGVS